MRELTEADVIALASAVAGSGGGGGGTGDGDMKMSVYDSSEEVKDAGGIKAFVAAEVNKLDGTISGTPGAGKTVTALSETNGKVSATFGAIEITKSQVSDFPTLGTLAAKNSASASYTPAGSVSVTQGTDTTTTVNSITNVGTLPSFSYANEKLTFNAGSLPTKGSDTTVVTASGTRTASFLGTAATITST